MQCQILWLAKQIIRPKLYSGNKFGLQWIAWLTFHSYKPNFDTLKAIKWAKDQILNKLTTMSDLLSILEESVNVNVHTYSIDKLTYINCMGTLIDTL